MPILNVADGTAHTLESLTLATRQLPAPVGIFSQHVPVREVGIETDTFKIDRAKEGIGILDPTLADAAPHKISVAGYSTKSLVTLKYDALVQVSAKETKNQREFGSQTLFEMPGDLLNRKLAKGYQTFGVTWEYTLIHGSLSKIVDKFGNVIVDLEDMIGVGPHNEILAVSGANDDVIKQLRVIKRGRREALGADAGSIKGWTLVLDGEAYEALLSNPKMEKQYERQGAWPVESREKGFVICDDVQVVPYENNYVLPGTTNTIFPTEHGILIPVMDELMQRRFSPAERMSTINKAGLPMNVIPIDRLDQTGIDIEMESHFATFPQWPEAVTKLEIA